MGVAGNREGGEVHLIPTLEGRQQGRKLALGAEEGRTSWSDTKEEEP